MKNIIHYFNSNREFLEDIAISTMVVMAFAVLGYFSREFALDLQVSFLGGWSMI